MTPHPPSPPRPDSRGDGDGWTECSRGERHWGLHGAAGLLLHRDSGDRREVLLQHRAAWSHHGDTWGLLGGARHRGETAVSAALREAAEEGGVAAAAVRVDGRFDDDHGGWSYASVVARAFDVEARPTGGETIDVAWVGADEVTDLPLHPGFATTWVVLHRALRPVTVVVDAANVVGSRPDGWWRDRAGASRRLLASCGRLVERGLADTVLPAGLERAPLTHWWPRLTVVLEGAARAGADAAPDGLEVVTAPGHGDDTVVQEAERAGRAGPVVVVTADRGLRDRCRGLATSVGPSWLLALLADG